MCLAAVLVQATYAEFGLVINFAKGKTEAMIRFRGKGSGAASRELRFVHTSVVECTSRVNSPFSLRFVDRYKHLGGWLDARACFQTDISVRRGMMNSAAAPLMRKFFRVMAIPVEKRKHVLCAVLLAKGLHISGTWPKLNDKQAKSFDSYMMQQYRRVVPNDPGKPYSSISDIRVVTEFGFVPPQALLTLKRVSLFFKVCRDGNRQLKSILYAAQCNPRSWLATISIELEFLSLHCKAFTSLRRAPLSEWIRLAVEYPHQMTTSLKKSISELSLLHYQTYEGVADVVDLEDAHTCSLCGDLWPTKQSLAAHMWKAHGETHEIRRFIHMGETSCMVCLIDVHSREKLVRHYAERSEICRINVMMRFEPMTEEETYDCDCHGRRTEISRRKAKGPEAIRRRGPVLPVIGQDDGSFFKKNGWKYLA